MINMFLVWVDTDRRQEIAMPLIRVSLRRSKPASYRGAMLEGLYQAMRENFVYEANNLCIQPSDDLAIVQLTVSNTRPRAQKQKLYRRIVEFLTKKPGLRAEDIFINLVEVLPENWSFGQGEAKYAR